MELILKDRSHSESVVVGLTGLQDGLAVVVQRLAVGLRELGLQLGLLAY